MTIAGILKAEPQSITIFRKYQVDYFTCRELNFEEVCRKYSIDAGKIKEELINLRKFSMRPHAPFDILVESILCQHRLIKVDVPLIREALLNATRYAATSRHELLTIKAKFETLVESLEIHLYKEEMILFPEFINLWRKQLHRTDYLLPFRLMYPIESLELEHESVMTILTGLKTSCSRDRMPKNTGECCAEVCRKLNAFERNLVRLINMENEVIFPEALAMEKFFTGRESST